MGQFYTPSPIIFLPRVTTMTIGAVTTPPTKGTIVDDYIDISRVGKWVTFTYVLNTSAAGAAGSGTYLFSLPAGYTIDTTIQKTTGGSAVITAGTTAVGIIPGGVGSFVTTSGPTSGTQTGVFAYSSTQFFCYAIGTTANAYIGSTGFQLSFATAYSIKFTVPVV